MIFRSEEKTRSHCTRAGDLVWAWDEETGDVALKPVVKTYINETSELTLSRHRLRLACGGLDSATPLCCDVDKGPKAAPVIK